MEKKEIRTIKKYLRAYMRKRKVEALNWSRQKSMYERITRNDFLDGFEEYLKTKK